jgi:hypothetical protein
MAEIRRTHILELRKGVGTPDSIALEAGREVGPMSVGTEGDWRVRAEGVREAHAFLYFDGERLFVQSADRREPATLDRVAVGEAWTEAHAPCTIAFGEAHAVFRSLSDDFDDATDVDEKPVPRLAKPVTARPFAPGAFAHRGDDESTRLEPLAAGPKTRAPLPAAGRPAFERPPPSGDATRVDVVRAERTVRTTSSPPSDNHPTRINVPAFDPRKPPQEAPAPLPAVMIAPRATPTAPIASVAAPVTRPGTAPGALAAAPPPIDVPPTAPVPAPAAPRGIGAAWRSASIPKKILVLLLPLALASVFVIFRDEPAPPRLPRAPSAAAPSASVSAAPPALPSATASVAAIAVADAAFPSFANADSGKSPAERAAVDAVAAGSYAEAIRLYDQLAVANPDKPAYREAARILRSKLDSGAP